MIIIGNASHSVIKRDRKKKSTDYYEDLKKNTFNKKERFVLLPFSEY